MHISGHYAYSYDSNDFPNNQCVSIVQKNPVMVWNRYCSLAGYTDLSDDTTLRQAFAFLKLLTVVLISSIGFIASTWTILELRSYSPNAQPSRENIGRSCKVIAYFNIYNMITIIGYTITAFYIYRYPILYFFGSIGLSIIGSAFNPLVRVALGKDIRRYLRKRLFVNPTASRNRKCLQSFASSEFFFSSTRK